MRAPGIFLEGLSQGRYAMTRRESSKTRGSPARTGLKPLARSLTKLDRQAASFCEAFTTAEMSRFLASPDGASLAREILVWIEVMKAELEVILGCLRELQEQHERHSPENFPR